MSLFDDSKRHGKPSAAFPDSRPTPFFIGNDNLPRHNPAHFYFHQDFEQYQDRLFLLFLRDRLIWLHGLDEDDPIVMKLLDIAHRCPRNVNSSSATGL